MINVQTRIVIIEKYPHYILRDIIKNKYKFAAVQEYDKAADYRKLEVEYFLKHFNVDIWGWNFEYSDAFHEETDLDKKVHLRIQLILESIHKFEIEKENKFIKIIELKSRYKVSTI